MIPYDRPVSSNDWIVTTFDARKSLCPNVFDLIVKTPHHFDFFCGRWIYLLLNYMSSIFTEKISASCVQVVQCGHIYNTLHSFWVTQPGKYRYFASHSDGSSIRLCARNANVRHGKPKIIHVIDVNMMRMMGISPFGHKAVGDLFRGQRDAFTSITLTHKWGFCQSTSIRSNGTCGSVPQGVKEHRRC
jgi:hypothetical protein